MQKTHKNIALVGGGSGGHVMPLLALAQYYEKNDDSYKFFWIWEKNSLEEEISLQNKIPFFRIWAVKLARYFDWKNFLIPLILSISFFQSLWQLKKLNIKHVFSKGGYVAVPVVCAAWALRIPISLHESDIHAGLANRITGWFATYIYLGTLEAKNFFSVSKKIIYTGQILNPKLFSDFQKKHFFKQLPDYKNTKPHFLVMGWGQGSACLFSFIHKHASDLLNFEIILILGTKNTSFFEIFKNVPHVHCFGFLSPEEIGQVYAWADVSLARAGITSLVELDTFGIKIIMVPHPFVGGNHQFKNAKIFEKKGHILLEQKNIFSLGKKILQEQKNYKKKVSSFKNPSEKVFQKIRF